MSWRTALDERLPRPRAALRLRRWLRLRGRFRGRRGLLAILAIVQEMAARLGVVTGQGLSDLIRARFGVRWTVFAMLVLLVANVANTVAEFSGASAATEIFGF